MPDSSRAAFFCLRADWSTRFLFLNLLLSFNFLVFPYGRTFFRPVIFSRCNSSLVSTKGPPPPPRAPWMIAMMLAIPPIHANWLCTVYELMQPRSQMDNEEDGGQNHCLYLIITIISKLPGSA